MVLRKEGKYMKEYERISTEAKLVKKETSDYFAVPGKIPSPETIYEISFQTSNQLLTFQVSLFEYEAVEEGLEGTLIYEGPEIISFGEWIKDFQM